jgi:hypothetical protein
MGVAREKNFLGKADANTRLQGRNRRQVPLPDKGIGVGVTTFMGAVGGGSGVASYGAAMPVRLLHEQMV